MCITSMVNSIFLDLYKLVTMNSLYIIFMSIHVIIVLYAIGDSSLVGNNVYSYPHQLQHCGYFLC